MTQQAEKELNALLGELIRRGNTNALSSYRPYPFQKAWHNAKGHDTTEPARQKALMAGNQTGKTQCGTIEDAFHATGLYPEWWEGERFTRPTKVLVAGVTADKVRDTLQSKLFGDPHDEEEFGTGTVPKDRIVGKPVRKQGYINSFDSVGVRHASGGTSRIAFQAYEQGAKKFMSSGFDIVHLDEEPPPDIYSQAVRSVIATGGIINLTFTPEDGVTEVVDGFMNDIQAGQALITATWDDAPHIRDNPKHKKQLLSVLRPHEREMRSKGIPQMGSGLIFPVTDETLTVKPFEVPVWWPRICGIDYGGFDHPFASVWLAWDRDNDIAYLYRAYKEMGTMSVHTDALKRGEGTWIPIAWPHDVGQRDKTSGRIIANIFREDYSLNMLPRSFTNPPAAGQKEGDGGIGVEAGLWNMLTAMETGRFKVFSTQTEWFREKGLYHRKDGKIVKRMDDLMDATRYAYQSVRYADIRPRSTTSHNKIPQGARNW